MNNFLTSAKRYFNKLASIYKIIQNKNAKGDKDKINKIFVNLLSNAFKYSEQGSVIRFDLSSQKGDNDNVWIIFDLSVTAQNMPSKEYLLKVFNPYEFDDFDIRIIEEEPSR